MNFLDVFYNYHREFEVEMLAGLDELIKHKDTGLGVRMLALFMKKSFPFVNAMIYVYCYMNDSKSAFSRGIVSLFCASALVVFLHRYF